MNYDKLCIYCMKEKEEKESVCPHCGHTAADYRGNGYELPPFTVLNGRYLLGRMIGAGGFGITYIAMDLVLERRVAVKEFFMQDAMYRTQAAAVTVSTINEAQDEMYRTSKAKFEREAKILAHLNSMPGIVQVHDFFQENGTAYIAMEYLGGKTLGEYVKEKGGRLSVEETKQILFPIMDSLSKIHKEGIIHRDISPDNIKFSEDGILKLYDFGGAKLEKGGAASKVVYMKPGYTPLEQYSANGNQGSWTDVYAMAATMYYCISGKRLPEAPDRSVRKNQALFGAGDVKVSKQVEKVLSKALEIYYEDRYQTMEEFSEALQEKDNRKKFVIPGIAIGAVLVIGVFVILFATKWKQDKKEQELVKSTAIKETEAQTEAGTIKETEKQTEKETEKETEKQTEKETEEQTEKQTETVKTRETELQTDLVIKETEKTEAETKKIENPVISYNGISAGMKCYVSSQSKGADIYYDFREQDEKLQHLVYGQDIVIEEVKGSFGKITWNGNEGWIDLERVRPYYLDAMGFEVGAKKCGGALLHESVDPKSESLGIRVPSGTIFWCGENAEEQENGMLHVIYTGEDADSGKVVQNIEGYLLLYWMKPLYGE